MTRTLLLLGLLVVGIAPGGCIRPAVCDFEVLDASDESKRFALLVGISSYDSANIDGHASAVEEIGAFSALLADLDFHADNICTLINEHATLENFVVATQELAAVGGDDASRALYVAALGGSVLDANGDEPDERDEALAFFDADGSGAGELLDDDLAKLLSHIRARSSSFLSVINANSRDGRQLVDVSLDRVVPQRWPESGDGATGFGIADDTLLVAATEMTNPAALARMIQDVVHQAAVHTPTERQFALQLALESRVRGNAIDVTGNRKINLFGLDRESLVALDTSGADLTLTLRNSRLATGIDDATATAVREQLGDAGISIVGPAGDFELSRSTDGQFVLRGPDNRARNRFSDVADLAEILQKHRQQKRALKIRGNGGSLLQDHETIAVDILPTPTQLPCAGGEWDPAGDDRIQEIPLCFQWYVRVSLAAGTPPLHISVLVMSSDGNSYLLPRTDVVDGIRSFRGGGHIFAAGPPIDVIEQVIVIGSTTPLDLLAAISGEPAVPDGALLTVGYRSYRVIANAAFVQSDPLTQREYTIKNFDLRPYLPDDDTTTLSRFLRKADELAKSSAVDGYSYKQHSWAEGSDAANLAKGIDCSRSIWYAFTRAGLPYNQHDTYIATADMVTTDSVMKDQFDRCALGGDYDVGDILVYRSAERGDGHVVSVIDSTKRIAWGSHGWDGAPRFEPALEPDTGVEYQKIRVKQDWQRWDRTDMQLKACWRYRSFTAELADGRGAGTRILDVTCAEQECRVHQGVEISDL